MKKVVYTCLTGNYDTLLQPLAIRDDWDYICFSDCLSGNRAGVWQIRSIPNQCKDVILSSRFPKLLPHKVLPEYDWSVYHDANMQIADEGFYEIISDHIENGDKICQVPHPWRDCIYKEIAECYRSGHFGYLKARAIRRHLLKDGFPAHYGLYENGLILRKHNDPDVIAADRMWWELFHKGARRDQLSLSYVYWKLGLKPALLFGEGINARNSSHINYYPHPARQVKQSVLSRKWNGFLRGQLSKYL